MQFPQKLFAGLIYCNKCTKKMNIENQTLYYEIVDSFFPMESRNPKFEIDNYLCFVKNQTLCCCTKISRYYGKCCIDAFLTTMTRP